MIKPLLIFFGMLVAFAFLTPERAMAQGMMGRFDQETATPSPTHEVKLDEALAEILGSQGLGSIDDVDCEKVSEAQFEILGDAWMDVMHPGEAHEFMDRMMARLPAPERSDGGQGGEGSQTLRGSHVLMGKNYLGCQAGIEGRWMPMMGMMGWGGMMNQNWSGSWGAWGGLHLLFGSVTWILVMALLVALIRYVWKKGNSGK